MNIVDLPLLPTTARVKRRSAEVINAQIQWETAIDNKAAGQSLTGPMGIRTSQQQPATQSGIAALLLWLVPLMAAACPICDTETGQQVRSGIFGDDFWMTLAAVAAPFPVLLLAIAAYHFDWPPFHKLSSPASTTNPNPSGQKP